MSEFAFQRDFQHGFLSQLEAIYSIVLAPSLPQTFEWAIAKSTM